MLAFESHLAPSKSKRKQELTIESAKLCLQHRAQTEAIRRQIKGRRSVLDIEHHQQQNNNPLVVAPRVDSILDWASEGASRAVRGESGRIGKNLPKCVVHQFLYIHKKSWGSVRYSYTFCGRPTTCIVVPMNRCSSAFCFSSERFARALYLPLFGVSVHWVVVAAVCRSC